MALLGSCHSGDIGAGISAPCDEPSDCREPYVCDRGRCRQACEQDTDCMDGKCVPSVAEPEARICLPNERCTGEACEDASAPTDAGQDADTVGCTLADGCGDSGSMASTDAAAVGPTGGSTGGGAGGASGTNGASGTGSGHDGGGDSGSGGADASGGMDGAAVSGGAGGTGFELDASALAAAVESVAPRTVVVLEPTTVRVFGNDMREADGAPVFVNDEHAGVLVAVGAREGRVALPGLAAGEYFLQVGSPARPGRAGARLVATERIEYEETSLVLPGYPSDIRYDAERRAFFGIFGSRLQRLRQEHGGWQLASVDLPSPSSFTISADGTDLLVTNPNCVLAHVDPDSLLLRGTETLSACYYSGLAAIDALADGTVLLLEPSAPSPMREYPSMEPFAAAPRLDSPMTLLSQHQTRLIMADGPTTSALHGIYSFDVSTRVFEDFTTLGGDYFQRSIIAVSAQGERFAHYDDIYDERLHYLGSLDAGDALPWTVALSGDGRVAVRFDYDAQTLRAYDVSGSTGPFPALAPAVPFARATYGTVSTLHVDYEGRTAVVFSSRYINSNTSEYRFVVRRIAP